MTPTSPTVAVAEATVGGNADAGIAARAAIEELDCGTTANTLAALPQIEAEIAAVLAEKEITDANELNATGWRVEVTHRGRYYFWRRGSAANRESRTGGKFAALPQERRDAYRKNAEKLAERKRNRSAVADTPAGN